METLTMLYQDKKINFGNTVWVTMPDGSRQRALAQYHDRAGITLNFTFLSLYSSQPNGPGTPVLSIQQTQAGVLLHELGHATKAPDADHTTKGKQDHKKSDDYNKKIAANCF